MNSQFLIFSLITLFSQPLCAKLTVTTTKKYRAKAEQVIKGIEILHVPNINLLKPLSKKRTQAEDEQIEKTMHHAIRKINLEPGFWSQFFFGSAAYDSALHPFVWYHGQVYETLQAVLQRIKKGSFLVKKLEKQCKNTKIKDSEKKQYEEEIILIEDLITELKSFITGLEDLLDFIKHSDIYLQERSGLIKTNEKRTQNAQLVNAITRK